MIRLPDSLARLASIQYVGEAGISASCLRAIQRFIKAGDHIHSALLLTANNVHAFLLNMGDQEYPTWVAVKTGFASGYNGEGPRSLSKALALLVAFDVPAEELVVDQSFLDRLDAAALTKKDLAFIEHAKFVRPCGIYDYIHREHFGQANEPSMLSLLHPTMPWGLLDPRLLDLARTFESTPDHSLIAGFRRLEELVRQRVGSRGTESLDSKVFHVAFMGEEPVLTWEGLPKSERIARGNLFISGYGAFRNPRAHREQQSEWDTDLSEFLLLNTLYKLEAAAVLFSPADT